MTSSEDASQNYSDATIKAKNPVIASKAALLDAEELDDYLSSLLLPQVCHAFKYFTFPLSASDIKPILSFITLCMSLKNTERNTPACKALGLRISVTKYSLLSSLGIYSFLKLILPALRKKSHQVNDHLSREIESSQNSDVEHRQQLVRMRRQKLLRILDATIPFMRLLLVLKCWGNLKMDSSHAPNLEKWLSGLEYQPMLPTAKTNSIHVLYAHRRWIHRWIHACVPILISPLLRSGRESRQLLSNWLE
jgi:hypothetical protein